VWWQKLGDPNFFIVCSALSTFSWGEVYSLFPAFAADLYGSTHVASTYGGLYTGKGVASILAGPAVSWAASVFTWSDIILAMGLASAVDSWLALGVLKPLLRRHSSV